MKKILLFAVAISLVGCTTVDEDCGCTPPPGPVEQLRISLVNSDGENLLSENTNGYLNDSLFTFYMLSNNKLSNLTELYNNFHFIENFGTIENSNKEIYLNYSWSLYFNEKTNTREGNYIIDYNNIYPNDTIYLKYQITKWEDSDNILEVKLNGVTQQTEPIDEFSKKLVIVK